MCCARQGSGIKEAVSSEDKSYELTLVESREISSAADSPVMLPNPANLKSQTKHSWLSGCPQAGQAVTFP